MVALGITESFEFLPEAIETHTSIVFLVGGRAYKFKKPLNLGFADFTSLQERRRSCQNEIELNRRLAPDVYLGMVDMVESGGIAVEHAVVMKRLPRLRQLSKLIEIGEDPLLFLRKVAKSMAALHGSAASEPKPDVRVSADSLKERWETNLAELRRVPSMEGFSDEIELMSRFSRNYLEGRRMLLSSRIQAGNIRDGHGDLRCDSIYCMEDGPRIVDCLEFDDALRTQDVACDVTFLAVDLEFAGKPELGREFLRLYREMSGQTWPDSFTHLNMAYWAGVRAKVAAIREAQTSSGLGAESARWIEIAIGHLQEAEVALVLVGGVPGAGKSTLAESLSEERGWLLLKSDDVRRDLAGVTRNDHLPSPYGEGHYSSAATEATYQELLRRASEVVAMGQSVVMDATWMQQAWRDSARLLAKDANCRIIEIQCVARRQIVDERIAARKSIPSEMSDATVEISRKIGDEFESWSQAWVVDTEKSPAMNVKLALELIE